MAVKVIDGDIIKLAKEGWFDVIVHGCNCFCTMGAGLAPKMAEAFKCNLFEKEKPQYRGDQSKLGTIDYQCVTIVIGTDEWDISEFDLTVVNAYTQYNYKKRVDDPPTVDYDAIKSVMIELNKTFAGKRIGLPRIGSGLAGGDESIIESIIRDQLIDCEVYIVNFKP
jgi:O-acetyl-ADP-ribose deacetylase (regulator of RNase III)